MCLCFWVAPIKWAHLSTKIYIRSSSSLAASAAAAAAVSAAAHHYFNATRLKCFAHVCWTYYSYYIYTHTREQWSESRVFVYRRTSARQFSHSARTCSIQCWNKNTGRHSVCLALSSSVFVWLAYITLYARYSIKPVGANVLLHLFAEH